MTAAERERHAINNAHNRRELHLLTNDLVVKACALALQRHPMFNSLLVDGEVRRHTAINISVAIALDEGLIAPAILDCQDKTLAEISQAARSLAERAKGGALKQEEYTGGTFTISNLGLYRIETLIAIIQPPQTAILGVGSVRDEPVVRDGKVEVAKLMKVALSADHRVTDGAQGARFLSDIKRLLEKPEPLLA
jgi:pyruvate dehydrogenase E2 component (dihydrolipoamide acetyltransferase)